MTRQELIAALQTPPLTWPSDDIALGIRHDFRCSFCERDLVASVEALDMRQKDHLHPKSDMGDNTFENLVVSSKLCNWAKGVYIPQGTTRDERRAQVTSTPPTRAPPPLALYPPPPPRYTPLEPQAQRTRPCCTWSDHLCSGRNGRRSPGWSSFTRVDPWHTPRRRNTSSARGSSCEGSRCSHLGR
jgi:HNH endonuclease